MARRKWLTTGELAEALGISATTVRTWSVDGIITPEFVTAGGHQRWNLEHVHEQLAAWREREAEREREQPDKD